MLGDWVIFFLALLLVPVLLLEETSTDPGVVGAATVANAVIWILFALDYAVDLWRAPPIVERTFARTGGTWR